MPKYHKGSRRDTTPVVLTTASVRPIAEGSFEEWRAMDPLLRIMHKVLPKMAEEAGIPYYTIGPRPPEAAAEA